MSGDTTEYARDEKFASTLRAGRIWLCEPPPTDASFHSTDRRARSLNEGDHGGDPFVPWAVLTEQHRDRYRKLVTADGEGDNQVAKPTWAQRMAELATPPYDPEVVHSQAEDILLEIARAAGHGDVADIFDSLELWYV